MQVHLASRPRPLKHKMGAQIHEKGGRCMPMMRTMRSHAWSCALKMRGSAFDFLLGCFNRPSIGLSAGRQAKGPYRHVKRLSTRTLLFVFVYSNWLNSTFVQGPLEHNLQMRLASRPLKSKMGAQAHGKRGGRHAYDAHNAQSCVVMRSDAH